MNTVEQVINAESTIDLVEELSNTFKDISSEKIVEIIPQILVYVKQFKKLKPTDKKDLIANILNLIIDKTDGPGDDEIFDPILKRLVPTLIDTFLKIDNGELNLRKPNCLRKCFTYPLEVPLTP